MSDSKKRKENTRLEQERDGYRDAHSKAVVRLQEALQREASLKHDNARLRGLALAALIADYNHIGSCSFEDRLLLIAGQHLPWCHAPKTVSAGDCYCGYDRVRREAASGTPAARIELLGNADALDVLSAALRLALVTAPTRETPTQESK